MPNMIEINIESLILFKEYSHLQLKTFKISTDLDNVQKTQVDTALEYHRMYASHRLSQSKPMDWLQEEKSRKYHQIDVMLG